MTKITAIHSGGDWADASAHYLVLPDGLDIGAERKKWKQSYEKEYRSDSTTILYVDFYEWLKKAGARDPLPDELTVYVCR